MTIDTQGDVFLTGTTTSNQALQPATDVFPATQVTYQNLPKASLQFFVTKVNTRAPSVGGIAYSTYFGGATPVPAVATGGGIAVDATGNMYFSGTTNFFNSGLGAFGDSGQSTDFPILNAYQPCLDTPPPPTLQNPNQCIAPTATPFPTDAFVAKINPLGPVGLQLLFSTYFGGGVTDSGPAIAVDSGAANIYLTGKTNSIDFLLPTGITPFQSCLDTPPVTPPVSTCTVTSTPTAPALFDAYVARLSNPTQNGTGTPVNVALNYFTYLGGTGDDSGAAIAVLNSPSTTPLDDVVLTGATKSTNFPTTAPGAFQSTLNGTQNAFFAEINTNTTVNQNQVGSFSTYFGGNGVDRGTGIAVDPNLNSYFVGDTTSGNVNNQGTLETKNPLQNKLVGTSNAFVVELGTAAQLCITCVQPVLSILGEVSAGNQVTATFTVTNEGPDPATNVEVNVSVSAGVTLVSASANSGTCSAPSNNALVCQIPTLQAGSLSQIAVLVTPNGTCTSCSVMATVSSSNNTNTNNTATASFTAGGYTVNISPPEHTVPAGLTAVYGVGLTPQGSFPGVVTLSCSPLPTGASCAFTSNTVSFSGGTSPASIQLNLTTTAQPVTTVASAGWLRPLYALWLMVPGIALFGVGSGGKGGGKKKRRVLGMLALSVLFALILLQPSCTSGKTQPTVSGTPSGSYALTITATSGTFTQSVPFSLTVVP
jgi:uncharacterized repeat protein (TIGR01451 family)